MEDQNNHEADADDIILGGDVCNCRKSKCLKLLVTFYRAWLTVLAEHTSKSLTVFQTCRYCQCFNAARVCNILCRCISCANTESNESGRSEAVKIILDRNPAAFDSKFLSVSSDTLKGFLNLLLHYHLTPSYHLSVIYRPSNLRIKVDASVVRVCASRNTVSVSKHPCRAAAHAPVLTAITQ